MNEAREDDLVRLPEGHVLREDVDWLRRLSSEMMCTVTACAGNKLGPDGLYVDETYGYCFRKDYPKQKRVVKLVGMALFKNEFATMELVRPEFVENWEDSGWVRTGKTYEIEVPE